MGADDILLDTAVRYLQTYALCGPITTIFFAMDNYLRICGFVKTSMFINIGCNVGTLGFLTLFLLVMDMDVVGSALATCIAMCISAVICLIPFLRKKALLKFTKPKFSISLFKQITACGSPIFFNNISGRITSILMNISLMTLGARLLGEGGGRTAVAVYAVLMYSSDLCWPLLYGVSDSLSPALGYNWGAKNYSRVKSIAMCAYIGTAIIGFASTSVLFFFPDMIASWFVNAEEVRLLDISTDAIRLFCFSYLFRWFGVTTQSYFSAIEKPLQATIISIGTAFVFPVVLLGALWSFGLDGIWFNFVGVNVLAAILSVLLLGRLMKEIARREKKQQ
jgi:Na+-driven multidrug efflux pump